MQRKFKFTIGEYYHVYSRGVDKAAIFRGREDWDRLQQLLYLSNGSKPLIYKQVKGSPYSWDRGQPITDIVGYTLMPNHFHVIARENRSNGLSTFMAKHLTAYAMYFNTKYERSGPLFCHPFRAKHIGDDDYFRWVLSYVHLNPLKGKGGGREAAESLKRYWYSSYMDYFVIERPEGRILSKEALPIDILELESVERMLAIIQDYPRGVLGTTDF